MKNSAAQKFSSAKSFAAAILFAAVALAFACGLAAEPVQAAVKYSDMDMKVGKTVKYSTSDYSKVKSSNAKVLKVTKKNGKWVVKAKKTGEYYKDKYSDTYESEAAFLYLYKDGELSEEILVSVCAPSKLIYVGKSAKYKTSEYSKVVSGNSKILKVTKKSGKWIATAKKAGETTLKLYKKGKLVKKMNVLTEKASSLKAVTTAKTLKVGKSFTWKTSGNTNAEIDYSISDTSVLSVAGGNKLKAKKPGKVTVTMKLIYGATTLKTYKRKVTVKALKKSEKTKVTKTINVPVATLSNGYNKTYINKKNIKMLETITISSYTTNSSVEQALVYPISSNSNPLSSLKITGNAAELVDVKNTTSTVNNNKRTGTYWYNSLDKVTEVYIRTNSTGKAVLTAEDYTHVYKITFNVVGMSNKSDGTLYTGWVNEDGYVINPDKAGANLQPQTAGGDTNTAAHTLLVYKGRFAKTAKEMQAAAKVNCTPIKKFLKSENWDDLDDFEKVKQIREFLFDEENLTYGQNKKLRGWSLVMYGKDGVCSDYSEAVSVLCKLLGLDVVQVSNDEHEWPLVKINGKWYDADLMNVSALNYESVDYYDTLSTSLIYTEMREGLIEYRTSRPSDKVYGYKGWNRSIISSFGGKVITEDI